MRLFEVDLGGARAVLSTLRGLADQHGRDAVIPFDVVKTAAGDVGDLLGNGGRNSKELLLQLKNQIDPEGKVIADVTDDAAVILNTEAPSDADVGMDASTGALPAGGPTVDKMASRNSKSVIK
jgi:hypothetical protein